MIKKNVLIVIAIVIFLTVIILMSKAFSPGSYNGAMKFQIEISENQAIIKIDSIKKLNKSDKYLREHNYIDGRRGENDYWYHFYVYYSDTEEVLNCWVRGDYNGGATIALVSIKINNKWKGLDKDFNIKEKKAIKDRFIKEYVNLIK